MPKVTPFLKSHPCIKKEEKPIMVPGDLPYPSALVFNAGVIKYRGEYVMSFRNDYGTDQTAFENERRDFSGTSIGIARSENGKDGWKFDPIPLIDSSKGFDDPEIKRMYDPRITLIDEKPYLCAAMDTRHGLCGVIAELSDDLTSYRIVSATVPDNRNLVLFPEKVGGEFIRLERPMPLYSRRRRDRFDVWLSRSPDLVYWGKSKLLLALEDVPWANDKIGPTASPIRTSEGWLTLFHAVDKNDERGKNGWEEKWAKRYTAGLMLLDLNDPSKVIAVGREPLLAPEKDFETDFGFRQNVIFPCGMILEDDGEVKIYYGASDTCVGLATAKLEDLLSTLG